MVNLLKKSFTILLITILAFQQVPAITALANLMEGKEIENNTLEDVSNSKTIKEKKEPKIIGEITEKRDNKTKYFLRDDNSFVAAVYPYPVHYKVKDKWVDIDNRLKEITGENGTELANKSNNFDIRVAKHSDAKKLIKIKKEKYQVSWNISNVEKVKAEVRPKDKNSYSKLTHNEKLKTLNYLSSTLDYKNILPNIDLQYVVLPDQVKENIIIREKTDDLSFTFHFQIQNLNATLQDDKTIEFYDKKNPSNKVFELEAPYMFDAGGEISNDVNIVFKEDGNNGFTLTVSPSKEWIKDSNRKYPITIDPTISTSLDKSAISDSHVSERYQDDNFNNSIISKTGYGSSSKRNRTYLSFDLPELTSSEMVTSASFGTLLLTEDKTNTQVNVHKVTDPWNSATITWNNQPKYDGSILDYRLLNHSAESWMEWDITEVVKEWYNNGTNNGLVMKNQDEMGKYNEYLTSDTHPAYSNIRPQMQIAYVNNSGLESYWTYQSQEIGKAGDSYINDYNGNLVLVHKDYQLGSARNPVYLNHVYNSNNKEDIGFGPGWRTNYNQIVEPKTINNVQYYEYIDEDGTNHYFKKNSSGTFVDESGLDLKLSINSNSSTERYTIIDKKDNKLTFTDKGYLKTLVDNKGNTIKLDYVNYQLWKITDPSGRILELKYNNGKLTDLVLPDGKRMYFGGYGTSQFRIRYTDGQASQYNFDSKGNLESVYDPYGYGMSFEYSPSKPYRITKIQEKLSSGTLGENLGIQYGFNETILTDYKGQKNFYTFNSLGHTISVRNSDGDSKYYKYNEDNSGGNINKLSLESKMQSPILNYLRNHNVETSNKDWSTTGWFDSIADLSFTSEESYIGNKSLKIVKNNHASRHFFNQQLQLEKGKTYTFSSFVKTKDITNDNGKGAVLFVGYYDKNGDIHYEYSDFISGTHDWSRNSITFKVPQDATSTTVFARAALQEEVGTVYYDSFQLEDGYNANHYNLVENPDFLYGSINPDFWESNSTQDTIYTASTQPNKFNSNVFRMIGDPNENKKLEQRIYISGNKGDTFVIGVLAKGDSARLRSGRYFALDLVIEGIDGTNQYVPVQYNQASNDWQFLSDVVKAEVDYKSVRVLAIYYKNVNRAHFDGIQLFREDFGTSYSYDSEGNIKTTDSIVKEKSSFDYNSDNELIKVINPEGSEFNYAYEDPKNSHNLTKATTAENVVYNFEHDDYGNPKVATLGSDSLYIKSNIEYTNTGNYVESLTDKAGNSTTYNWDEKENELDSMVDADGKTINYTYDDLSRMLSASKAVGIDLVKNEYQYKNNRIERIDFNGNQVSFNYDGLGRLLDTKVGAQTISTNIYEESDSYKTSNLKKSIYGNQQSIGYDYDKFNRIKTIKYNDVVSFNKEFDSSGNVGFFEDFVNKQTTKYTYDLADRLTHFRTKSTDSKEQYSFSYDYDTQGNVGKVTESNGDTSYRTSYNFNKDNQLTNTAFSSLSSIPDLEVFLLDEDLKGTNGTKPIEDNSQYYISWQGNNVLKSYGDLNLYDLNLDKQEGTMGVWFKTREENISRHILSNSDDSNGLFTVYIDSDNKLKLYGRSSSRQFEVWLTSTKTISLEDWHNVVLRWKIVNGELEVTVNIDDEVLKTTRTDFYDFSNTKTSLGTNLLGNDSLKGYLEQFSYSPRKLSDVEVNKMKEIGRLQNSRYYYDELGRLKTKQLYTGQVFYNTEIEYEKSSRGTNASTKRIKSIKNEGEIISYTYDKFDNIKTMSVDGKTITYDYNELNELVREDNQILNKTITYQYDLGGNIKNKSEYSLTSEPILGTPTKTIPYKYEDTNWTDKLTSYDGKPITYDAIGNPLTYDGLTFTWERIDKLSKVNGNGKNIEYKYDMDGYRTQKTVNGTTTKYILDNDKVIFESNGMDKIHYTYTSQGDLVNLNLNGVDYFYLRNNQNDVIGLINNQGIQVVSYQYDSWGNIINIEDSSVDSVGEKNPYRYRGYRYDIETGYYYLNSRYYNPKFGRFINADSFGGNTGELLSHNMFAYVKNNPTTYDDPSGYFNPYPAGFEGTKVFECGRGPTCPSAKLISSPPVPTPSNNPKSSSTSTSDYGRNSGVSAIGAGMDKSTERLYPKNKWVDTNVKRTEKIAPNKYLTTTIKFDYTKITKVVKLAGPVGLAAGVGNDMLRGDSLLIAGINNLGGSIIGGLTGYALGFALAPFAIPAIGVAVIGGLVGGLAYTYMTRNTRPSDWLGLN